MSNEQLFAPILRGVLTTEATSKVNQWAGRTVLASGDATVTVSTQAVAADSIIRYGVQAHVDQASGSITRGIEVKTISPGNFFTLGTADGIAEIRNVTVMWELVKAS